MVEPESFQRGIMTGGEATDTAGTWEILIRDRKTYFSLGWSDTETGFPEGL